MLTDDNGILQTWQSTWEKTKVLVNNNTNASLVTLPTLNGGFLNFQFEDANGNPVNTGTAGTLTITGVFKTKAAVSLLTVDLSTPTQQTYEGLYDQLLLSVSGLTGAVKVGVTVIQGNFKKGGGTIGFDVVSPLVKSSDGKTLSINDASTSQKGAVQLTSDATNKTSEDKAMTQKGVANAVTAGTPDATTTVKGLTTLQVSTSNVTSTTNAATPKYVKDLIEQSILSPNVLAQAYGASTSNIALTGSVTYSGLKIPTGSRWLAAGQTNAANNGVYVTNDGGAWTRATDADTAAELYLAQITAVNGDAGQYLCTIASTAVIGTTDITFIQLYKADNQFVGVQLYNPAAVYAINTLVVDPTSSQYIWQVLIDGTNNITPSMASPNWEIYQGLLYQNSAVVAPNGNDVKSPGFPYATFSGAITDLSIGAYIEGRAVTTVEAVTPKANMYLSGKNAQVSKVTLSADNCIIESLNLLGTVANPVTISVNGAISSTIRNLTATANGASNSVEFTGAWDGIHRLSGLRLTGNINIAGATTAGIILVSDILSSVTLTVNCANARVYVQNCPNLTLVETAGDIISDTNASVIYVSTNGLDSNNGLTYYTAKKTLAAAATLAGNSGRQIVVYPGTYTETATITNQNLFITAVNQERSAIVNFTNPITLSPVGSSIRVAGITFATLNKTSAGSLYLYDCTTSVFSDTGSGYVEALNTDTQGSTLVGTVSITGTGVKNFGTNCTTGFLTVNNAAAIVNLARNISAAPMVLTTGFLGVGGGIPIYAATGTGNAITATGGTLQVDGATMLTPTNTSARISIGTGVNYVLKNISYDAGNSTISNSAIPIASDLVLNAQTDRIGTLAAAGTIPVNQEYTICTAATATYLVSLPSASIARGRLFKIKNSSASTFPITTVVNTKTYTLSPNEAILVESDGSSFHTVSLPASAIGFSVGDSKTGMQTADHNGWLLWSNGRVLSRTTYTALWAFVQANSLVAAGIFGNGDGTTTFTLGDILGRSLGLAGSGSGVTTRALGSKVGSETHTLNINEIPSHSHYVQGYVFTDYDANDIFSNRQGLDTGANQYNTNSVGGGQSHNNMQPTVFLNFFIYAG
jgi:microcystin-dependent protein